MKTDLPTVVCPYCRRDATLMENSAPIYHGRDFGPVWICRPCEAWVGCHPHTLKPLGRLADAQLRKAKISAHAAFDAVWEKRFHRKKANDPKYTKGMARGGRYKRLAELMQIDRSLCHIGMMDVQQCKIVIDLCKSGAMEDAPSNSEESANAYANAAIKRDQIARHEGREDHDRDSTGRILSAGSK